MSRIFWLRLPERLFWVCLGILLVVTILANGVLTPATSGLASCAGCGL